MELLFRLNFQPIAWSDWILYLTARKVILENLQIKFPSAKISVRKATAKTSTGVAYIATVKNAQGAALKDLPKVMILSFEAEGNEIQNSDI